MVPGRGVEVRDAEVWRGKAEIADANVWISLANTRQLARRDHIIAKPGQGVLAVVVDVRRYPGSKTCPQFNKEEMVKILKEENISYVHIEKLGGR